MTHLQRLIGSPMIGLNRAVKDPIVCYGGGKSPSVETVKATPPPAPPAEEATMEEFTDEETDKQKKTAKAQGATSLSIPLIGTTGTTTSVGQAK